MTGVTNMPKFMMMPRALLISRVTEFNRDKKKPNPAVRKRRGTSTTKLRSMEGSGTKPTHTKIIIKRGILMRKSNMVCPMAENTSTSLGKLILVSMLPAATRLFEVVVTP